MSSQRKATSLLKKAYNVTFKSLKNNPALFFPFVAFAIIEVLTLIIIFLAPRMPLKLIFGPPIRTFWGERFLHYPLNFLLLPKLVFIAKMGLSIFLGSLLTGMAVAIAFDIYNKNPLRLKVSFNTAFKKYLSLFAVVLLFIGIFYFLVKIFTIGLMKYFLAGHRQLLFLEMKTWMGPILFIINFILAILIQSTFIYAIPALIIDKEKLIRSITKSFGLFKKLLIPTVILVGLPMFIYIPIIILQQNSAFLINRVFPEIILWISILGIIVSSLIIDPIVTISTAVLYLINKES